MVEQLHNTHNDFKVDSLILMLIILLAICVPNISQYQEVCTY
jgi:hypothetical protein